MKPYTVTFTWLPTGGDKSRKTVVKAAASTWPLALQIALRAIALDKSIPDDATVRSVKL